MSYAEEVGLEDEVTKCPTCGQEDFTSEQYMRAHHKRVHGKSIAKEMGVCVECEEEFEYYPRVTCGKYCRDCSDRTKLKEKPDDLEISDSGWSEMTVNQRYYYRNKDSMLEKNKRQRVERQEWLESEKQNWKCSRCDEDNIATLQFHHTDENEYDRSLYDMTYSLGLETIKREYIRGKILCANCHLKLHYEKNSGFPIKK